MTGGTLKQSGVVIPWNDAGFYEVALDLRITHDFRVREDGKDGKLTWLL